MRVSTAFNRLLRIPGTSVTHVLIGDDGVDVTVRPRSRLLRCPCGLLTSTFYDRRRRRWRHLDLGTQRLWLVYEIHRINCPECGVITEQVPWARPRARHTYDFEDTLLWLAKRTDRTTVATLLRCSWRAVTEIINRAVTAMLESSPAADATCIGVDEICYRHPHKYLTVIGDHDSGKVIHIEPGRSSQSLAKFYARQTNTHRRKLAAVSMDAAPAWFATTRQCAPNARICIDPFHVIQWVNRALDRVFNDANARRRELNLRSHHYRRARGALRAGHERLDDQRRALVADAIAADHTLATAWRLKEDLRDLYRLDWDTTGAADHLDEWIDRAHASNITPMINAANTIRARKTDILAAVELGVSNSLLEGINAKIRLINNRGYGHHSAETLSSMIYLCCGRIEPKLPTRT